MKKLFLSLLVIGSLVISHKAEAQRIGFYFYPQLNIYFNPQTHMYAYPDRGVWVYHEAPPPGWHERTYEHVMVYGHGPEIWRENEWHREHYRGWHGNPGRGWEHHPGRGHAYGHYKHDDDERFERGDRDEEREHGNGHGRGNGEGHGHGHGGERGGHWEWH